MYRAGAAMSFPHVSIILPTYNRADTLPRAVRSVMAQSFEDWELLLIDDGSTDGSAEQAAALDPRIRLIRQANAGVYVARNLGLQEARGQYLTFLDSDDAWQPHFLALTTAFLRWSPNDHFVTTEFEQDFGAHVERHDHHSISQPYLRFAQAIDSHGLALPPGESDDYLRVYDSREALGPWGQAIAASAGYPEASLYRGHIFAHMRWGYLNWLPVTVITRHAMNTLGPFSTRTRNAADYHYLGRLSRAFRANMIGVPSAVKYERAQGNRQLAQGHLATGANAYSFEVNKLSYFDDLYAAELPTDPELQLVRCHYELYAGLSALRLGKRHLARQHLTHAARWRPHLRRAYGLRLLAQLLPSDRSAAGLVQSSLRLRDLLDRLRSGQTNLGHVSRKLLGMDT